MDCLFFVHPSFLSSCSSPYVLFGVKEEPGGTMKLVGLVSVSKQLRGELRSITYLLFCEEDHRSINNHQQQYKEP